ncbi:hypothetical protein COCON_G00039390 [Conger conger]|uniref:Uncharacterized protein n=1 Tax=Conger conger TaxID=82655 RepID=A0A9Q1I750_CONCO|nr:hypothetical protein COCON_G00039390 [Conger conger]
MKQRRLRGIGSMNLGATQISSLRYKRRTWVNTKAKKDKKDNFPFPFTYCCKIIMRDGPKEGLNPLSDSS